MGGYPNAQFPWFYPNPDLLGYFTFFQMFCLGLKTNLNIHKSVVMFTFFILDWK